MTINDLKETAGMAHLNPDEGETARLFPAFAEMLTFFDSMQASGEDRAAFPEGLASVSSACCGLFGSALAGSSGNCQTVDSGFYRTGTSVNSNNSSDSIESLLDNAGERDGRFFVIPNVL